MKLPWRYLYGENDGYDCMYGAYTILNNKDEEVCVLDTCVDSDVPGYEEIRKEKESLAKFICDNANKQYAFVSDGEKQ